MEPQELSLAMLQAQVRVVSTLGELLDTLPRREEKEMLLLECLKRLYRGLEEFTKELRVTLRCTDDTWKRCIVTDDGDGGVTSLSQALAAYRSTPRTTQDRVAMAAREWHQVVSVLVDRWAQLNRKASELRDTWSEVATEAMTAELRELQAKAVRDGTSEEQMVELGQAQGGGGRGGGRREEGAKVAARAEFPVREGARVAAREATRATMVREQLEVALWPLERLVAACVEATAFPRELLFLLGDIKATLEASPDVPDALVAKVAEAEPLWEANTHLAKGHLLGIIDDILNYYSKGGRARPSAREVDKWCQIAMEDVSRLLRPLERPQRILKLSELSPAPLQAQVTVVSTLGELLDTLPRRDEEMLLLLMPPGCLHEDLSKFTRELWETMRCANCVWSHCYDPDSVAYRVTSLSRALAAYESTPWTTWRNVTMTARAWPVWVLADSWDEVARRAAKLRDACRAVVAEAASEEATATTRVRKLREKAARDGTAQENVAGLGQALGGEKGAEVVAGHGGQVREQATVAATQATRAIRRRQRLEAALGLLERLVAACDEATAFPRELQRRVGDIETALEDTNEASPKVPEDLVAKVAEAEWLWEATTCLGKDHLLGAVDHIVKFCFNFGDNSYTGVDERCRRAMKDIPRLLRPRERPQGVPKAFPLSKELQELFLALLQPQVTVVATLGELLDTLPRRDEEMLVLMSPGCPYWDLEEFTNDLWATMSCIDDTCRRHNVTSDDGDPVTSLSRALAAYKSTPGTPRKRVTTAASEWHQSVDTLEQSWAQVARKASELRDIYRKVASEAAKRAATTAARARGLKAWVALYGTAQENVVELDQALGWEGKFRRKAVVAASEATRATTVTQQLEAALGLLQRLVAACDKATAFPRELQRRLGDIEAALEGTNEASPDVPEDLVAKVAVAERLWEANARLAEDHLLGTLGDIIGVHFTCGPTGPSVCGVTKRCQRATKDIPNLLGPPENVQTIPKVSPVSTELQERCSALLQAQVTVVATLGELLDTLPRQDKEIPLPVSAVSLYWDLVDFTENLLVTLYCVDDAWWHRNVTDNDDDNPPTCDDGDHLISLSQALAAYQSTEWTAWHHVTMAAGKWQRSVAVLVERWAQLARRATKLHSTCREVATEAATKAATIATRARELQEKGARDGTAQGNMVGLGQALGGEEGAEVVAGHGAQVRRDAMVAASEATRATVVTQRLDAALGLLQRLVAACDEAAAFPRELQRRVGKIKTTVEGTNEASPKVPEGLVAKVAEAEQLWEANARLAKGHLLGAVPDTIKFLFDGGPDSPCEVAKEWCQRATEDIPRLLRPPECPQSVPEVSPLSPAMLQPQVTVVATLGKVLATLPTLEEEETLLLESPGRLHRGLKEFTMELWDTRYCIEDTWRRHIVTEDRDGGVTSLSQALAAYRSTPRITWLRVTMAGEWQGLVAALVASWAQLVRKATELRDTCRDLATKAADRAGTATSQGRELQAQAARDGTALERTGELAQALGGEEGAEGAARPQSPVREEAMVAASEARRVRQRLWAALGLLQRLVAACRKGTAFPRELQRLLRDTRAALQGTNEGSPTIPEDLVAKVAVAERLWEANARLAKGHLLGIIDDILNFYSKGGHARPSAHEVDEWCQRAAEEIRNLLQG
ncbi:uncharacterized protein LOC131570181 [Ammospiza caudacuta]|uniref:uncharacterized protein LOC131570181 n=1 Tax=Ammospiza caudacuta TaxID=2857398 RepID=UPI002738668C|nr:uncharacterized protein LOC131570181 [Ammospiza caudacuta]